MTTDNQRQKRFRITVLALSGLSLIALGGLPAAALGPQDDGHHKEHVKVERQIVIRAGDAGAEDEMRWVYMDDDGHAKTGAVPFRTFLMHRGYIGVGLLDLTPELRSHFGVPEDAGVMISRIEEASPADRAGLRVADILTAIDGEPVGGSRDVAHRIGSQEAETTLTLEVWRDGALQILTAEVGERRRPQVDVGGLIWSGPDAGTLEFDPEVFTIDSEKLNRSLENLRERMGTPEWGGRIQQYNEGQDDLRQRLLELEERLEELESQLEGLPE